MTISIVTSISGEILHYDTSDLLFDTKKKTLTEKDFINQIKKKFKTKGKLSSIFLSQFDNDIYCFENDISVYLIGYKEGKKQSPITFYFNNNISNNNNDDNEEDNDDLMNGDPIYVFDDYALFATSNNNNNTTSLTATQLNYHNIIPLTILQITEIYEHITSISNTYSTTMLQDINLPDEDGCDNDNDEEDDTFEMDSNYSENNYIEVDESDIIGNHHHHHQINNSNNKDEDDIQNDPLLTNEYIELPDPNDDDQSDINTIMTAVSMKNDHLPQKAIYENLLFYEPYEYNIAN